ncbi:DUF2786 domain-containing protein [Modestobacter roseus]|uniref:Uncharacterized protein DUF2786 n=1 Tax=Modestobacter roseus TaxID=1181884 RepID=A0A562ILR0_9ACTN|nr:DUF2786 domain-containing protein [Modestobacter roseus]MQA34283.1 DUF2786 domain-containing protein [Modestobacter roseus]TWH71880.1 uncharacterized protein DUF2786 [Modestobacter roseus]
MPGTTTTDDVLRLLLAGGRLAAEPGVRVADLDRVVVRLTSRDPGVDSDGQAQRVIGDLLPHLWEGGWQPADVVHVVRRRATQRAARLAATVIAGSAPAGADAAPAAWSAQLAALDARGGTVSEWWRAEGTPAAAAWREVLRVIGVLRGLPRVEELLPPPSRWTAGAAPGPAVVTDERALGRIRGLLAKAESTEFAAEAEALTAKAQELMARHAIDAAMGEGATGIGEGGVTARRFHLDDPHVEAKAAVLQGVAAANGVRVVLMPAFGIATLVGFAADLDLVELLVTSLLVQAGRALDHELREGGSRTRATAWRRGFWLAYAARVAERLTDARDAARAEARATYGGALVPLLADREATVDRAVEELFPHVRRRQGPMVDPAGWDAGRRAADEADLGGGRRALPG